VIASFIAIGGVLMIILVNWWGLIYIAAAALFFWQAFAPVSGRTYPRQEDVHPPTLPGKSDEDS
jgi:hypothetical protein